MIETTTIRVSFKTKERLEKVKIYSRETMDDILNRLIEGQGLNGDKK